MNDMALGYIQEWRWDLQNSWEVGKLGVSLLGRFHPGCHCICLPGGPL